MKRKTKTRKYCHEFDGRVIAITPWRRNGRRWIVIEQRKEKTP